VEPGRRAEDANTDMPSQNCLAKFCVSKVCWRMTGVVRDAVLLSASSFGWTDKIPCNLIRSSTVATPVVLWIPPIDEAKIQVWAYEQRLPHLVRL
jgi:hypothetical protein